MDVHFEHWQHTFSRELLDKYSSRYYSGAERGHAGMKAILGHATRQVQFSTALSNDQILCANEAFPESAIADPIADLDVWDAWQNEKRQFPFRGYYRRLGIKGPKRKRSSNTTVGVLGEILAGLFGQCGVAPLIVVRVVGKWPDFIFALGERRFAFVESKAFAGKPDGKSDLMGWLQKGLLLEAAGDAIHELAVDDSLSIWYSFTHIETVKPLKVNVTFLELKSGRSGIRKADSAVLPPAVVEGLARRALEQGLGRAYAASGEDFEQQVTARDTRRIDDLRRMASEIVPELIDEAGIPPHDDKSRRGAETAIEEAMGRTLGKLGGKKTHCDRDETMVGRRLSEAKTTAAKGELTPLRMVGNRSIFIADLPGHSIAELRGGWLPDWQKVNCPWGDVHDEPLWRCSGVVLCISDRIVGGEQLGG